MNNQKVRGPRFYLEYEYDSFTKDMLEDLLRLYSDSDDILTKAIGLLHENHFGSMIKRSPPPKYSETLSTADDTANRKLDELWLFVQSLKLDDKHKIPVKADAKSQNIDYQLSEEANKKIIAKIEELGMKFSKIEQIPDTLMGTQKPVTAEMSSEEIIQLIKRIDQLESKLTRAISQSRVATAPVSTGHRGMRDFGDAPKIEIKKVDGPVQDSVERPLLDDVLDTVIVSVEKDEE
ncbi:MAG: hypothetical protein EAX90_11490 [Candidatus Heimdallarchaeota archaeon]|nr:hypothetical protein [Candidatus Heimdallarchaeota archaeon]